MIDPYRRTDAAFHAAMTRPFAKTTYEAIVAISRVPSKGKVLDVGGGEGRVAEFFAENKYKPVLLDPSTVMLRLIRHKKIVARRGTAENIPYKQSTFDLVYCVGSFHHFSTGTPLKNWTALYNKSVREMIRVLKKNGKLIIMELNPTKWVWGRIAALTEKRLGCCFFTPKEMTKLFKKIGCSITVYEKGSSYVAVITR